MFDLIRDKYEPNRYNVEMQATAAQTVETATTVQYEEANKIDYASLTLNAVMFICGISLMIYGAVHLDDCPAMKMIAISLIVIGALVFFSRLVNSPYEIRRALGSTNVPPKNACVLWLTLIVQLVILGWFFAMAYFVYKIKDHINKEDPDAPDYCESYYYKNMFWASTIGLVSMIIVIILMIGAVFYFRAKQRK